MSTIGYKVAQSSGNRVLITLLIPPDALTNMNRYSIAVKENAPIDMIAEGLTNRGRFQVRILWSIVAIIMIILYCIFN